MLKPASSPTEQLKGRWGVTACLLLSVLLCLTLLPTQALAVQEAADSKPARSNEVEAAAAMTAADPATSTAAAAPADIKEKPSLTARAHVQIYGWTTTVANVKPESIIGTHGKRKRMEALRLSFSSKRGIQGGITYRAHVQTYGWQSWVSDGAMAGTSGKAKRIEAVQIKLTGDMAKRYDVYYQAHVQKVGWTAWAKNGQTAGSSGLSYRMEALRIQLVEKGGKAPAAVSGDGGTKPYWTVQSTTRAHVQKTGTMIAKGHQLTATCTLGTVGQSKRLEAFSAAFATKGLTCQAHVAKVGWMAERSDGALAGTTGKRLAVQAVRFNVTGKLAQDYDVHYRAHVSKIGWMGWAKNGQVAGTTACSLPMEAVQIKLVPKGGKAPGSTKMSSLDGSSLPIALQAGWKKDGAWATAKSNAVAGATDKKPLRGISVNVHKQPAASEANGAAGLSGGVSYRAHVAKKGWLGWSSNGAQSASGNNAVQALQVKLTGDYATYFDVYVRSHVVGHGWLGWAKNGASSGSTGLGKSLDAYQVRLVPKGGAAPGSTARAFSDKNGFLAPYQGVAKLTAAVSAAPSGLAVRGSGFNMDSASGKRLRRAISAEESGGRSVGFVMVDLRSGATDSYNANRSYYSASSIKGPYVAAICQYVPAAVNGVRGTMQQTIAVSSNEGYSVLRSRFGAYPMAALQKSVGGCGFPSGRNYSYMTPKDLAKLWVGCYDYFYVHGNQHSAWARNLYTNPLLSYIHGSLGGRYTTHTKPGWIAEGSYYLARNDAGIVMAGDRPYVLAVMSTAYGKDPQLSELVSAIDGVHSAMF